MITIEMLDANDQLKTLAPEAKEALIALSAADETKIIGQQRGEWWRDLDKDIAGITGVNKPDGIKSYQFLKDQLTTLKSEAEKAKNIDNVAAELEALKKQNLELEKAAKNGITDAEAKRKIEELERRILDKEGELKSFKETKETVIADLTKELESEKSTTMAATIGSMIDQHIVDSNVAFLDTIPDNIRSKFLKDEKAKVIAAMNADFIQTEDGQRSIVLRDEDNNIIYDAKTSKPLTPGQFFLSNGDIGSLIDPGKQQAGGGGAPNPAGGGGGSFSIAGVANQVEADEAIEAHLMKDLGLSKLSSEYDDKYIELRDSLKVSDLPLT